MTLSHAIKAASVCWEDYQVNPGGPQLALRPASREQLAPDGQDRQRERLVVFSHGTCTTPPTGATSYVYDANGNTTTAGATTHTYNVFDQFTSSTSTGTTTNFTYAGTRNDERLTAGSTGFLNGTLGVTRQTTAGASTSFIRDPSGTLISMRNSTGASFYFTTDALGSTILLTDSAQAAAATYTYDSWGNTTATGSQAAANPWQYAGGYKDTATGYTRFGARYYNAARGRFTQPDPSGQESNRYAYAGCNPVNTTDPSGLGPWCDQATYLSEVWAVFRTLFQVLAFSTGDQKFLVIAIYAGVVSFAYKLDAFYYCAVGL